MHSIVAGPIEGHFLPVFDKLAKLHAKNAFSLAIIVGDLFKDPADSSSEDDENISSLLNGEITVPLPVYFTIGQHALPSKVIEKLESSDYEVCQNLYFLGKRSTTKTEGLRIVALGGRLDTAITAGTSKEKYLPFHTEEDAKTLKGANSADILITTHWPTLIRSGSNVDLPVVTAQTEQCVADLCSTLKPRYHFTLSDEAFYEREPFFHLTEDGRPDPMSITRFLSLASFGNFSKQKWLYAFTIDPNATATATITPGTTASPFSPFSGRKRQRQADDNQSFSRFSNGGDHYRPTKSARTRRSQPTPQQCFFCLSNPNLATHLITSIATDTYLTISKGPLPTATTFPQLGFPAHVLIMPLTHAPTLSSVSEQEVRSATYKEMQRYRRALHNMLIDKAGSSLGAITWEISRADGVHFHWQFMPAPAELIQKGLVEAAFKVQAENEKYPTFKAKDIGDGTAEKGDYFRVWIWCLEKDEAVGADVANGEHISDDETNKTRGREKSLVLSLPAGTRFDLQFGRRVMAKFLGLEVRTHWKDCPQTEKEEQQDAETFKAAFKKFDFSLEE